ncbi:uncharacterized protein LOC143376808 isoform X2 [Andrena cerasifolii]|uniref:uncharacterized protein LOC143376808 isoform X2 n=1 Tax=Andrena cerasifolii TaxID=2819439 RepID=UPI0040377A67
MGKVVRDTAASGSSEDQRRKTVRVEQKVRAKKKKRKRDLTDLHEKLYKSKKRNQKPTEFWRSNFVKLLHRFAGIREEYSKETKITGKLCRPRNSKKICNRILPRPLTGIYRNGATGKDIRRSQTKAPVNDINNARLQGNVLKLLHGYDSKSKGVVVENGTEEASKDPLLDSTIKTILHPTPPGSESISPVLGKVDGQKRCQKDEQAAKGPSRHGGFLEKCLQSETLIHPENCRRSAVNRYEELCATISSKNFEGHNSLDQFTADPLVTVKKKLRSIYAESFQNQFLRDMIKRNTVLNRCETPSLSSENELSSETGYRSSTYRTGAEIPSAVKGNPGRQDRCRASKEENNSQGPSTVLLVERGFNLNGKWNQVPTPNLLFDLSLLQGPGIRAGLETVAESKRTKRATENKSDNCLTRTNQYLPSSLEVNHSAMSTSKSSSPKYFENPVPTHQNRTERMKKASKTVLFLPNEAELSNDFAVKKHLIKRRNQRTQTMHSLNSAARRDSGKHAFKASQQIKAKCQKHIPAILRRCGSNNPVNLFTETMDSIEEPREMFLHSALKQNDLFDPGPLITELNRTSKVLERSASANVLFDASSVSDLNVQTCVIASPSLRKDEVRFIRNPYPQVEPKQRLQTINDILPTNKQRAEPPVHKTIMFTKKDSRNIGHCLRVNNLISDGTASNVCLKRKSLPQEKSTKDICTAHRNCQRVSANCYRSFHCSQSTDTSNYSSQEFKEPGVAQEEPVICEKVLLRRMQQHKQCESSQKSHEKDQRFCYVLVDQRQDSSSSSNYIDNRPCTVEDPRQLQNGRCCREDVGEIGILNGVQNLKILPMEERESGMSFTSSQCIGSTVMLEEPPIKYLAFEKDSKTHKLPIYVQNSEPVAPVDNVEVINPNMNYRVVSRPQEPAQKIILVPTSEQNKVVYVQQQNLGHDAPYEGCGHRRQMVLCRQDCQPSVRCVQDSPNVCGLHVPKQSVLGISSAECEGIATNLQQADNMKHLQRANVNWGELRYRPTHAPNCKQRLRKDPSAFLSDIYVPNLAKCVIYNVYFFLVYLIRSVNKNYLLRFLFAIIFASICGVCILEELANKWPS